jgi:aquaporin Z
MRDALAKHWPEYLMEAAELGLFMISASVFTIVLEHPESVIRQAIPSDFIRRVLTGIAMGLTAISIIYSPWGKQSGAHFNPSVTLTFLRLGRVKHWDATFYVIAQFAGGIGGVLLASVFLGDLLAHPKVRYAATLPGDWGVFAAFLGEAVITFILMSVLLSMMSVEKISRYTGFIAGILVAIYITFEGPISGMSMNPARTLGSAVGAQIFDSLWVYFTAPLIGMFAAAEIHLRRTDVSVICAKLHHQNSKRCIHCGANTMAEIAV